MKNRCFLYLRKGYNLRSVHLSTKRFVYKEKVRPCDGRTEVNHFKKMRKLAM